MKSISPIIATILLFIVLVGLSAFAYFYFSGAMSQLFQITAQRTQQTTVSVLQCSRVGGDIVINPPLGKLEFL